MGNEHFWNWAMSQFFDFFLSVSYEITGENPENQFLSFPIISSSNEPGGRAIHWKMNTIGIGESLIFSKIS